MKKLMLAFLAVAYSQSSFAFFEEQVQFGQTALYQGGGSLISSLPKKKSIRFQSTSEVTRLDASDTLVVNRSEDLGGGHSSEWIYRTRPNAEKPNFYTLYDGSGENMIGEGYCFMFAEMRGKKCHYEMTIDGQWYEQTFTVLGSRIYRMTSSKHGEEMLLWRESLQLDALPPTP